MAKKNPLRVRLMKEYEKVSKSAVREPRNGKEIFTRMRWERLHKIIMKRYV